MVTSCRVITNCDLTRVQLKLVDRHAIRALSAYRTGGPDRVDCRGVKTKLGSGFSDAKLKGLVSVLGGQFYRVKWIDLVFECAREAPIINSFEKHSGEFTVRTGVRARES